MVEGKFRSRTKRRIFIKTPGGKNKILYKKRNMGKITCANCGKELHGMPRMVKNAFRNLPKTKKRPERPYGGNLCSQCMREKIKEKWK